MMQRRFVSLIALGAMIATALPSLAQQQQTLVRFSGQLLDVRNGYVYFTTGDAFKLAPAPKYADYDTGAPTTLTPRAKLFARAVLDPQTHAVVELDLTAHRVAADKSYDAVKQYASTTSTPQPAPEIVGRALSGKQVAVVFDITVPPTTPISANVYISTDQSGWNPQAIKLDRVDGQHYKASRTFASGTKFSFKVTRGSWNSVALGQNGLELPAFDFFVNETDAQFKRETVYAWSDDRAGGGSVAVPGAIPTPFNPNPFPAGGPFPGPQRTPYPVYPPGPQKPPNQPPG